MVLNHHTLYSRIQRWQQLNSRKLHPKINGFQTVCNNRRAYQTQHCIDTIFANNGRKIHWIGIEWEAVGGMQCVTPMLFRFFFLCWPVEIHQQIRRMSLFSIKLVNVWQRWSNPISPFSNINRSIDFYHITAYYARANRYAKCECCAAEQNIFEMNVMLFGVATPPRTQTPFCCASVVQSFSSKRYKLLPTIFQSHFTLPYFKSILSLNKCRKYNHKINA